MAKKFSSDAERKAAMANMNGESKGTNSKDVNNGDPIPIDPSDNNNKMVRRNDKTFKEIRVWSYEDADDDLQEKILENYRNKYSGQDDFFAQDEGILFDKDEKKDGLDIGLKNLMPENYEVGGNRGDDYIQFDLEIADRKKFVEYLGLAKSLGTDEQLGKISIDFENLSGSFGADNTRLVFKDINESEISLANDTGALGDHYGEDKDIAEEDRMFRDEDIPTLDEFVTMLQAFDKFADLMDDSLVNLRNAYEHQFSEEFIIEEIKANEFVFDDNGDIA